MKEWMCQLLHGCARVSPHGNEGAREVPNQDVRQHFISRNQMKKTLEAIFNEQDELL